jgi:hypothetical protein
MTYLLLKIWLLLKQQVQLPMLQLQPLHPMYKQVGHLEDTDLWMKELGKPCLKQHLMVLLYWAIQLLLQ